MPVGYREGSELTCRLRRCSLALGSTTDSVKEGIEKTAETLKHATEKVADAIKDTAHHAGGEMGRAAYDRSRGREHAVRAADWCGLPARSAVRAAAFLCRR